MGGAKGKSVSDESKPSQSDRNHAYKNQTHFEKPIKMFY